MKPPVAVSPAPRLPIEERYAASWVLVAWQGARGAGPAVSRDRGEARVRAAGVRERLVAGEPVAKLARELSDAPDAGRGGQIGVWNTGTMEPALEEAVGQVKVGECTAVTETPFGWAVACREAVDIARMRLILVAWQGAEPRQAVRTRAEAQARAEAALARIQGGEPFGSVARELSDDPSAASEGDVGAIGRGQVFPALEQALFGLAPGAVSGLVETPVGFAIVRRDASAP